MTTASPYGRRSSIPKFGSRWRTYRSSSTNEPGSHSRSARSRASSFPARWRSTPSRSRRAAPPRAAARATRASPRWTRASSRAPRPSPSREEPTIGVVASLDRSTIWPYEEGEPGEFYYQRYGHPAGVAAERALGELDGGHALLFSVRCRGDDRARARVARARRDNRTRGGRLLRNRSAFREPRTLGTELRRVRPDWTGARRRAARLARGAVESVPDDARPRSGRRARGASSSSTQPRRRRFICVRSSTAPTSSSTARRSTSRATTTCCSEPSSPGVKRTRRGCTTSAPRRASSPRPIRAWLLLRSLETLPLRVERQTESARELARRLDAHASVQVVRYPGLRRPHAPSTSPTERPRAVSKRRHE